MYGSNNNSFRKKWISLLDSLVLILYLVTMGDLKVSNVLDVAKKGWDAVVDMYKNSNPEERKMILKILAGLGGFGALLKYLRGL